MIKSLSTEDTLENSGLSAEEQKLFCNARPRAYEPYPIKAVEDFANWCEGFTRRGNTLFIPEMRGQGAVDSFLHRFTQQTLTELLAQQCHRHFALAETLHLDFGLRFFQLFFDFRVQLGSRHGDGITALEAFVQGLGDLHVFPIA